MSSTCRLARTLFDRVSHRPEIRAAVAGAVAVEDARALAVLLGALGLDSSDAAVQAFLDAPGPFLPSPTGWT
jgi:hypothetical protein